MNTDTNSDDMPRFHEEMGTATETTLSVSVAGSHTPVASVDQATRIVIAHIDGLMHEAMAKGFGGAIVIKRGQTLLISKGYGFADRERRIPFTPDTIAQIGSITKSQTAAALATLIAEGKVLLSDPVARFVPEAPEPGRSRTAAQLLTHSSGLADACANDFDPLSEAEFVKRCLAMPLAHAPGEDHYSNVGYSALALILQRATNKSWEEAVRERVWRPLAMRDIGFRFDGRSDALFARGYLNTVAEPVISRSIAALNGDDWALKGNGGVQASSLTMIRFLDGILARHSKIDPAAQQLILAPVPGQLGEVQNGFGLAFRYGEGGKLVRVGHSGSDGVFFSYLAWVPANDVRFYFVGNNGEDEVKPVLQQALKAAIDLAPG